LPSVKISQLPEVTTTSGTDRFLVVQGGTSKQILLNKLFNGLISNQNINFNVLTNDFKVTNAGLDIITVKGDTTNNVGIFNNNPLARLHVGGSFQIGVPAVISSMVNTPATTTGIAITPYDLIRNAGVISLATDTTLVSVNTAVNYVLGNGTNGQSKTIILYDVSSGGAVSIGASNKIGFSSINMGSVGASVTLKFVNNVWCIVNSYNVSISV